MHEAGMQGRALMRVIRRLRKMENKDKVSDGVSSSEARVLTNNLKQSRKIRTCLYTLLSEGTNGSFFVFRIIATPGRLLHLIVEMNLDLKSVQYVVFDEADRLF